MGWKEKALAKAFDGLDVEKLAATLTDAVYSQLLDAGHKMEGAWGTSGWQAECLNCGFYANGTSTGAVGKMAVDKMAEVHLKELING